MSVIAFDPSELRSVQSLPTGRGCDFCADGQPSWRYPARDTALGIVCFGDRTVRPISVGGWASCEECSDLIEAGDWPALARHTLRSLDLDLSQAGPGTRVRLLAMIHHAHEAFRRARSGPRETVS